MVIRAVEMAIWQRQGDWSVILHSARGSQFTSADYQRFLNRNTLVCSMSAVWHCGDNAAFEGFFGQLKRERIAHQSYRTRDEARANLFARYIEEEEWPSTAPSRLHDTPCQNSRMKHATGVSLPPIPPAGDTY